MDEIKNKNDISIDFNLLSTTITNLKKDNDKISEMVDKIYENINILTDEKVWKSPEKEKVIDELMPYLEDAKTSLPGELNTCLDTLNVALYNYINGNELLNKAAREITKIVGV